MSHKRLRHYYRYPLVDDETLDVSPPITSPELSKPLELVSNEVGPSVTGPLGSGGGACSGTAGGGAGVVAAFSITFFACAIKSDLEVDLLSAVSVTQARLITPPPH